MNSGAPYFYDYINAETSQVTPSTIHVRNTALSAFFRRYLFQKAMSVFKWNLPENWEENYFLYTLYGFGYNTIIYTDKFGVIPQQCGLGGYSVQYQPTFVTIANPHFTGIKQPVIDEECVLMKLQPNYCGIVDIVSYYGDLMALASEAVSMNLVNSKLAYAFISGNKAGAEAMKKLYDKVAGGDPAVVYDKSYNNDDGSKPWETVFNNLRENFITPDLLSAMKKIEAMFDTDIGIPNANTDKRERLITDEVNSNNAETLSKCALWLDQCQKSCNKVNKMFGNYLESPVSVDWRFKNNVKEVYDEELSNSERDI